MIHQAGSGVCLSKSKLLHYLLEGTAASHLESIDVDEKDATEVFHHGISTGRMFCNYSTFHVNLFPPFVFPCQWFGDHAFKHEILCWSLEKLELFGETW